MTNWILIPENYQPDTKESREETGMKYTKYYTEEAHTRLFNEKLFLEHEATNAKVALQVARKEIEELKYQLAEQITTNLQTLSYANKFRAERNTAESDNEKLILEMSDDRKAMVLLARERDDAMIEASELRALVETMKMSEVASKYQLDVEKTRSAKLAEALKNTLSHTRGCSYDNATGDESDYCTCNLRERRNALAEYGASK